MNYSLALDQKDLLILHKDMFKEETVFDTTTNMYQHVIQLRERVVGLEAWKEATESLEKACEKHREYANGKTKIPTFKHGDKLLVLLPEKMVSLLISFQGTFEILDRITAAAYNTNINGKGKIYHINLLKLFLNRPNYT